MVYEKRQKGEKVKMSYDWIFTFHPFAFLSLVINTISE